MILQAGRVLHHLVHQTVTAALIGSGEIHGKKKNNLGHWFSSIGNKDVDVKIIAVWLSPNQNPTQT